MRTFFFFSSHQEAQAVLNAFKNDPKKFLRACFASFWNEQIGSQDAILATLVKDSFRKYEIHRQGITGTLTL